MWHGSIVASILGWTPIPHKKPGREYLPPLNVLALCSPWFDLNIRPIRHRHFCSNFLWSLKLHQISSFQGLRPAPLWGSLQHSPDILADGKGARCPWWGGGSLLQMSPSAVLHSSPTRPTIINMNFLSTEMYLQDIVKRKNKQQCMAVRLQN